MARAVARPRVRLLGGIVAVGLGYWALAQLGAAAQYTGGIQVAWLPVGFAAAMLYLGDLRWFIGAAAADLILGTGLIPFHFDTLTNPTSIETVSNTIEFTLAAILMRRWLGRGSRLERPSDVAWLALAIGIGTAISAVCGGFAQLWAGVTQWSGMPSVIRTWWLGDTSGGLLIAPLLLVWAGRRWHWRWQWRAALQTVAIMGAVVGLSIAVFTSSHPLTYIVFPALIVAAVYLGQRGATVALVLAFAVAVAMTASNVGPFVERSINDEALSTQLYILVATLTTLTLGAAVSAQRHAGIELAEARRREVERGAEERQRIARDLHDSVSQTLFSLGLHTGIAKHEVARATLAPGSTLPATIDEVAELAHGALLEMRASIFELRGGAVAEQGIVAALAAHGAALTVRHDVHVTIEGPDDRLPLASQAEELLFRIAQEAMTNAVKHSGSQTVSVSLAVERGQAQLVVCDQGVGFDADRSYAGHLGLELMRTRAADAGGTATVQSSPDSGTTVRAVVPTSATAEVSPDPLGPPVARPASVS